MDAVKIRCLWGIFRGGIFRTIQFINLSQPCAYVIIFGRNLLPLDSQTEYKEKEKRRNQINPAQFV